MAWPSSAAAILQLRNLLFDGPTDKLASQKKVLGVIDGVNTIFKTFETRRVNSFAASAPFPQGLYLNGSPVLVTNVIQDEPISGVFQLGPSAVPSNLTRDSLTATYYFQWFEDSELDQFLQNATSWLGLSNNYINIPDGLNASALRFASQEAYLAISNKYSVRMAQTFQLEDAPNEDVLKSIQAFQSMAKDYMASAETMRNDFYTRQGQALAPNFNFQLGKVWDPTPRR
jgi:hypothetical protein